ncbi:MAG: carbohydrate kinase [Cyanobacteria bacterium SW_9_44_58]|nr:MAG: carbohydrate kinase [Cyanobacteria bacterium SW_9_44_58]
MTFYLGIDFGTSGARAVAIDENRTIQAQQECPFTTQKNWVQQWREALFFLLNQIPVPVKQQVGQIAINGTSSTVLRCDRAGVPLSPPLLYRDCASQSILEQIQQIAPADHVVQSASSSLAKLLYWQQQEGLSRNEYFLHQADWLACLLHGRLGISDYHNALKLGYDVKALSYPQWLKELSCFPILPKVLPPGTPVASVTSEIAKQFCFPPECQVCTGTTDSIAAFIASGARQPGEAVTSLGSTLALKLLSKTPVQATQYGVYSHRFGNFWLTGGASNTGGAVLKQFFSDQQLQDLSAQINPAQPTSLDYYPLTEPGERFPINDPNLLPKLRPRPEDNAAFLQGLLESMARIETQGYQKLQELGATPLSRVYTAGGGAKNETWQTIREQYLKVAVHPSPHTDAAYGSALLAQGDI